MNIRAIGGEFALIDRLVRHAPATHPDLVAGVGDDAAVIGNSFSNGDYLLVTTDMLVEHSHFRCDWATAEQIGQKSVSCNVSDIAAMGGRPSFMFVSLCLAESTEEAWLDGLYTGLAEACRRYDVVLAGGDTTRGTAVTISITLLGRVAPPHLCLRRHARPGDLLCVTGPLGGSAAGLAMLSAGLKPPGYLREKYLTPGCRLDVAPLIAPLAHAMIDISDGLAPETHHICDHSGTGARIVAADIPIHPSVHDAAETTATDVIALALSGGEDFELLFSMPPDKLQVLRDGGAEVTVVGQVTEAAAGRHLIMPNGEQVPLAGGYDHFSRG